MAVRPIPEGYSTVTPYLVVDGAADAIAFYTKVFGAVTKVRMDAPGGRVAHAELAIGDSTVMLGDESPEMGALGPHSVGGSPVGLLLYVEDVDNVFARAVAAGGTVKRPLVDQFYGDRSGTVVDPFGHQWTIATHIADPTPEEIQRGMDEALRQRATG